MAALPNLMTVEQFMLLPENGEFVYELHYGKLVAMTRPRPRHCDLQMRLADILRPLLRSFGTIVGEWPYRAVAEFDLRAADVAGISQARYEASLKHDEYLLGAPELVIEVKSRSNRRGKLAETAGLCLANGCLQFWVIDQVKQTVTVTHKDGVSTVYRPGDSIPLAPFAAGALAARDIFV